MIILAVDFGKSRTGLAISDKNEVLAYPIGMIEEKNQEKLAKKIKIQVENNKAEIIVLGLPKNMNGSEGGSARDVREFSKILKKILDIPIIFWDERCTTIYASSILKNVNVFKKKRKNIIDTVSAVIILENYLLYRTNNRN